MRSKRILLLLLAALFWATIPAHAAGGTVNVYYAASLADLNEKLIGPSFGVARGYTYQGKSAGSVAIANQIKSQIANPDVVEFADPAVNALLMGQGGQVSWYLTFARSELVVGFDPQSKFAPLFKQAEKGKAPWYAALSQKGLRLGRTDPNLDPKGYRTIFMARLAQKEYHLKNFARKLLGSDTNPEQVFPEEVLVARVLTGQLDAGVFYLSEVKSLGLPYLRLPDTINLGNPRRAKLYATQHFTSSQGVRFTGAPVEYTITIPNTARNPDGARAFVAFVLSKRVRSIAALHGLLSLPISLHGNRSAVPAGLQTYIGKG